MIEIKTISLTPIADLADEMQNYSPVSIAIGPRNEYCVLLTKEQQDLTVILMKVFSGISDGTNQSAVKV